MTFGRAIRHGFILLAISLIPVGLLWVTGRIASPKIEYAAGQLKQGDIPLWHGTRPLLGSGAAPVFFPVNLLVLAVPAPWAWPLIWGINFLIAAFGAWLLALPGKPESKYGHILAAGAFTLAVFILSVSCKPQAEVLVCLPWVILTLRWLLNRITPFRFAITAAVFAFQFLAGSEAAPIEFIAAFYFAGARPWRGLIVFPAAAVGAALAGIQFIPSFQYIPENWHLPLAAGCIGGGLSLGLILFLRHARCRSQWSLVAISGVEITILLIAFALSSPDLVSDTHPTVWEMPSATYVPTPAQAQAMNADPHTQLIVDGQVSNPYNEPIGRLDTVIPSLMNPPVPGQAEIDQHWWMHTGSAQDTLQPQYPNDETITVDATGNTGGWLVISNPYDPGWQAFYITIQRQRGQTTDREFHTPIVRANGKFQTIFLPPQVTRVIFRYDSPSWRYALFASIAGLVALCLLLGLSLMSVTSQGGCHDGMGLVERSNAPLVGSPDRP